MPLDAICLTAVVEELKKTLVGGQGGQNLPAHPG